MDPNANLTEQLRISARIVNGRALAGDAERLAELVEALAAWLESGGFLPQAWER